MSALPEIPEIPEEPERVPGRPLYQLLAGTVLVIVASGFVVWALLAFQLDGGGRSDVVQRSQLSPLRPVEGVPPAAPFSMPLQPEREQAAARAALERWRWADPARRRVLVPVDVAIDRYLAQRGAAP